MKVGVLTEPRHIELVERELPPLTPTQVRVRVRQCGVCTGELDAWSGKADERLPLEVGHEVAGVVEEVGSAVAELAVGDDVAVWIEEGGGFAEQVVQEQRFCVRVAPGLAYPAVAEPLACIVGAVELTAPRLGDDVVIVGAGFMGNLLQLVSALKGPRSVTVADVRPDALARAAELGATRVVDSARESLEDVVREVTEGRGADVTYEVTGVQPGLDLAGAVTRMGGKVCIVGYHLGGARAIPLGTWNWMAFHVVNAHFRDPDEIMRSMRAGMRLVSTGALDVGRLMTDVFPLAQTSEAFARAVERPEGFVKAVVEPAA